jgi:hypothetical protein
MDYCTYSIDLSYSAHTALQMSKNPPHCLKVFRLWTPNLTNYSDSLC